MSDTDPLASSRRQLREQRLANRLTEERLRGRQLAHIDRRSELRERLRESALYDWVTPYAELLDAGRRDPALTGPAAAWQRRRGANWPIFRTEQELSLLRAPARLLLATNSYAQGLVSGLTSYVIASGCTYRVTPRKGWEDRCPPALTAAAQTVIDDFLRINQWHGGEVPGLEEELFERSLEDGEFVLAHYPQDDGTVQVRTAEPEQLTEPPADCLEPGETAEFGVITPREDAQHALGYWVQHGDARDDGERLPPERVTHLKRNARRSMKRGVTDFCFDALDATYLAGRLRTNLAEGAAQQAGIVGVRQHESGNREEIQKAWADDPADYDQRSIGGKTTPVRRYRGGEWEDIPKGSMYVPGPGAQNAPAHVQVLQACLRSVGVKWNAPEWLVSGDASNNNFASSLVAESPFVKTVLRQQRRYREAYRAPAWYALEHWCRTRGLAVGGRTLGWDDVRRLVDLVVEAPSPEARDRTAEAQRAAIEIPLGVDSRQGYTQRQGRDYVQVQADNQAYDEEHGGDDGPPLGGPGPGGGGGGGFGGGPLAERDGSDPVGRALLEAGFTGQITDSAGRQRYYVDGKQVSRDAFQQSGGRPQNDPTRNVERAKAARQLLANAGSLTPDQFAELAGHLRASSNADLQAMKRDLQARGGGRRKEEMVSRLLAHVGMAGTGGGGAGGGSTGGGGTGGAGSSGNGATSGAGASGGGTSPPPPPVGAGGVDYQHKDANSPVVQRLMADAELTRKVAEYHAMAVRTQGELEPLRESRIQTQEAFEVYQRTQSASDFKKYQEKRDRFYRESERIAARKSEARAALTQQFGVPNPSTIRVRPSPVDLPVRNKDGTTTVHPKSKAPTPEQRDILISSHRFVQSLTGGMNLIYGLVDSADGRAFCQDRAPIAGIDAAIGVGKIYHMLDANPIAAFRAQAAQTQAHEMGHLIEAKKPGIRRLCQEFLAYRTRGEQPVALDSVLPGHGYRPDEFGRKDDFERTFGDLNSAYYAGKPYPDGSTEILSMGIEELYNDPLGLCVRDPEYFHFLLSVLK